MEAVWVPGKGRGSTVGRQGERKEKSREGSPGREKFQMPGVWNFIGVLPSLVSQQYELFQLLNPAPERWWERSQEDSTHKGRSHFKKYDYNEH